VGRYKSETDLYDLAKAKTRPDCISVSNDGHSFAMTSSDAKVRQPGGCYLRAGVVTTTATRPAVAYNPFPPPHHHHHHHRHHHHHHHHHYTNTLTKLCPCDAATQVRVFQFLTGKLRRKYDESVAAYDARIAAGEIEGVRF
jgi:hypothetical protein